MVTSEREMIRNHQNDDDAASERVTSLQPTYEETVAPSPEDDWDDVDD